MVVQDDSDLDELIAQLNPKPVIIEQAAVSNAIVERSVDIVKKDENDEFDLAKTRRDFDLVSDEILGTWRDDRRQTQEVIDLLLGRVRGENAARVDVEGLVQALSVKSDSGMIAVKLLEAKTRLLAATKNQVNIQTNVINHNDKSELIKILAQPMTSDFESD